MVDLSVMYEEGEYEEHLASLRELVKQEQHFHLTLLPSAPFRDLLIISLEKSVAVLRREAPLTAFVFTNPLLTQSVAAYFDMLIEQYSAERTVTVRKLEEHLEN